jgi:integrase
MASFRKHGKNWYFRFVDGDGVRRERKGCPDRRVTEDMARDAETRAARIRAGLSDPKAERMAREARRPIEEHIGEFITAMEVARRNVQHIAQTRSSIVRLCGLARVERLADLTPSGMAAALAKLREEGLATRTVQAHATAVKAFSKWAWRDGRTVDYALNALVKPSDPTDRRRVRRPLIEAELRTLIETTRAAPTWRGVSGVDRAMIYLIASMTGFRRDELLSLTRASFRLDDRPPVAICESAYTKDRRRAEQPLPASLVDTLRPWLAAKPPGRKVFEAVSPRRTAEMLRLDLGRCDIPYEDADGRVVDMHSLRHGYITALAQAGVPVKTVQTLARHADPRLTMNVYAHATLFDTSGAVEALPDLSQSPPNPQIHAATGTDGPLPHRQLSDPADPAAMDPGKSGMDGPPISERLSHHFPTGGVVSSRDQSPSVAMPRSDAPASADEKTPISQGFDASSRDQSLSDGRLVGAGRGRLDQTCCLSARGRLLFRRPGRNIMAPTPNK